MRHAHHLKRLLMLVMQTAPHACATTNAVGGTATVAMTTDDAMTTVVTTTNAPISSTANLTGLTYCYIHESLNTTCLSYSGICYVRYAVDLNAFTYACLSYAAVGANVNVTIDAVDKGTCVTNYHGYYANGLCEYCCLGNLCNRNKTSSWIKTDCSVLRSSATSVTMAAGVVAVVMVTSWRIIMPAV